MARKDFVPGSYKNRHDWSANDSAGVGAVATRIGWPKTSVTILKSQLNSLTTATQAVLDAQHALDTAVGQLAAIKGSVLAQVQVETKSFKATNGFTEDDAKALGNSTTLANPNSNTCQLILEATAWHGYVDLMAKKPGLYAPRRNRALDAALSQAFLLPFPRRLTRLDGRDDAGPQMHGDGRHRRPRNWQSEQHRQRGFTIINHGNWEFVISSNSATVRHAKDCQ